MNDRTSAEHARPGDPDWGVLIRAELDSWEPERLPARFTPRGASRRRFGGWRPLAVAVAVTLLGVSAGTLVSTPGGLAGAWQQLTGQRTTVSPAPARPAGAAGAPVTAPGRLASPAAPQAPAATAPAATPPSAGAPAGQSGPPAQAPPAAQLPQAPPQPAPPATNPTAGGVQLPVPTPAAVVPTPTPAPSPTCVLNVLGVCVPKP